ncbi:hypothetical protein O1611_g3123 [Lasiodiplodia mahajangana]|uniref:Uncharacterized protein n=1 Tax=Lasiodiplodia mahajangana TaxID=1108764 RepID=A0ACC2JTJ8_9PEZI|nr:hypothetical protein O1611_g3123 [Lasiodiplodia mahajangana]
MDAYGPVMLSSAVDNVRQRRTAHKADKSTHLAKLIRAMNDKRSHVTAKKNRVVSPKTTVRGLWKQRDSDTETVSEDSQEISTEASLELAPLKSAKPGKSTKGGYNSTAQARPVQATDVRITNASGGSESGAVSDTSFTPPKKLHRLVRIDDEGRRHVLPPHEIRRLTPFKHKSRFIHADLEGKRHLLPPPGFSGLFPKHIEEHPVGPCILSFKRRNDFKKAEEQCGGISLAVMKERESSKTPRKVRFAMALTRPTGYCPIPPSRRAIPTSMPPPLPSATDRRVAGWSSPFAKRLFEIENELLYDGRWPISTF